MILVYFFFGSNLCIIQPEKWKSLLGSSGLNPTFKQGSAAET